MTSGLYFAFRKRNPYINGLSICCPNRQTKLIRSENNSLENNMKKRRKVAVPGLSAHVNSSIDLINCLGTRNLFLSKDRV